MALNVGLMVGLRVLLKGEIAGNKKEPFGSLVGGVLFSG